METKYRITGEGREYLLFNPPGPPRTQPETSLAQRVKTPEGGLWAVTFSVEKSPGTTKEIAERMGTWFFPDVGSLRRAMRAAFEEGYIEEVKEQ